MPNSRLTLAVAGSGKTQSIVSECAAAPADERILVLTYTSANQDELAGRLASEAGHVRRLEVTGWFAFLIAHFVKPYLPFAYPGKRIEGFDFESPPQQRVGSSEWRRYFNSKSGARRVHLAQLAHRVNESAGGAPVRRLERVFDRIFIDEVQDLCGWDLEILRLLMDAGIAVEMVGDVRQAILATNAREQKNKQFMYMKIWSWFRAQEQAGRLEIAQVCDTRRCRPEIAALADSLFSAELGFETTVSLNDTATDHDGIFLVRSADVDDYVSAYSPLVLRRQANSGRELNHLNPMNIGLSKGLGRDHVLIRPTDQMARLLKSATPLEQQQAAYLYVAVTRARQSVAFILDDPGDSSLPYWTAPASDAEIETVQIRAEPDRAEGS